MHKTIESDDEHTNAATYVVVVNDRRELSIWPGQFSVPLGWHADGKCGTEDECLAHIAEICPDIRPPLARRHCTRGLNHGSLDEVQHSAPSVVAWLLGKCVEGSVHEIAGFSLERQVQAGWVQLRLQNDGSMIVISMRLDDTFSTWRTLHVKDEQLVLTGTFALDGSDLRCTTRVEPETLYVAATVVLAAFERR